MQLDILLGLQWGDEGKGKITDVLTPNYDIIARFQGGPNAGHTLEFEGKKHVLHTIPSGIFHPAKINLIGNGVIIDPAILAKEIMLLREKNVKPEKNLLISKRAHLILPTHRLLDKVYEYEKGNLKIGSTLKGIGPTYTDKIARLGLRIGEVNTISFKEKYEHLKKNHLRIIESYNFPDKEFNIDGYSFLDYEKLWFDGLKYINDIALVDGEIFINESLAANKRILGEGAQGALLDVDFGTYPFVTSSNTTAAGACSGLGIAPQRVRNVYGVFKAYCTRVGSGPFPTELFDDNAMHMQNKGKEFGSTTGRVRRCGWLDLPSLKYSTIINGVTQLIMMKSDVLDELEKINICTDYEINNQLFKLPTYESMYENIKPIYREFKGWKENISDIKEECKLPNNFIEYYNFIENELETPIKVISIGPDRSQTILK